MSKGSTRRPEDRQAVEDNFPPKANRCVKCDKIIPRNHSYCGPCYPYDDACDAYKRDQDRRYRNGDW